MPVTNRPLQPSPWAARNAAAKQPVVRSTNRLIAIAFTAMVAVSALFFLINGVN